MSQGADDSATTDDRSNPPTDGSHLRLRSHVRVGVFLLVIVLAGCLAGAPGPDHATDTTGTTTQECIYPDIDPAIPRCLIGERPPDLDYRNSGVDAYNLSVRITRNGSTVFSRNVTVRSGATGTFEDVISSPGWYIIHATADDGFTHTKFLALDRRYRGGGDSEWEIVIQPGGDIDIHRYVHQ